MGAWMYTLVYCGLLYVQAWYFSWRAPRQKPHGYGRRKSNAEISPSPAVRTRRKSDWIRTAVLALARELEKTGCRTVAQTFNRLYAHTGASIGKTFVNELLRTERAEKELDRRALKRRRHGPGQKNRVWGLDLTGKTDETGETHMILGILDHGTRANLMLRALSNKATITILRQLLDAIEQFGKPRFVRTDFVRTDNEAIFQSRLFRLVLNMLGIRHQRIAPHCPWQNGRIERFFGTLKRKLNDWLVPDCDGLNASLAAFRLWYNHIRPHQHLHGKTPAEVWQGNDVFKHPCTQATWFEAWEGLLTGYHLRR